MIRHHSSFRAVVLLLLSLLPVAAVAEEAPSLVGWVRAQGAESLRASIEARPKMAGDAVSEADLEQRKALRFRVESDERGRFELADLAPGTYLVSAEMDGYASATVEAEVRPADMGEERLDEVVLDLLPLAVVTMILDPPTDPWQGDWTVGINRREAGSNVLESVSEGQTRGGEWQSETLEPGNYELRVVDSRGGQWHRETIELVGGPEELFRPIEVVEVRGSVSFGELGGEDVEPNEDGLVGGVLYFGHGSAAIPLELEEDGRFVGSLPEEGTWAVELKLGDVRRAVDAVDVHVRPGKSHAEVEIALANTLVAGQVQKNGEGVRALVVAVRGGLDRRNPTPGEARRREFFLWTDDEGQFEVPWIEEGAIEIRASDKGSESGWQSVRVEEGRITEVLLDLSARQRLVGTVTAAGGPVPGTQILVQPVGGLATGTTSGADGQYSVGLAAEIRQAEIVVLPSEGGFFLRRIELGPDIETRLDLVIPGAGTLVLRTVVPGGFLFYDGVGVPIPHLLGKAADRFRPHPDGGLVLPPAAPGEWSYCPGSDPRAEACRRARLVPGGTAILEPVVEASEAGKSG